MCVFIYFSMYIFIVYIICILWGKDVLSPQDDRWLPMGPCSPKARPPGAGNTAEEDVLRWAEAEPWPSSEMDRK